MTKKHMSDKTTVSALQLAVMMQKLRDTYELMESMDPEVPSEILDQLRDLYSDLYALYEKTEEEAQ